MSSPLQGAKGDQGEKGIQGRVGVRVSRIHVNCSLCYNGLRLPPINSTNSNSVL